MSDKSALAKLQEEAELWREYIARTESDLANARDRLNDTVDEMTKIVDGYRSKDDAP